MSDLTQAAQQLMSLNSQAIAAEQFATGKLADANTLVDASAIRTDYAQKGHIVSLKEHHTEVLLLQSDNAKAIALLNKNHLADMTDQANQSSRERRQLLDGHRQHVRMNNILYSVVLLVVILLASISAWDTYQASTALGKSQLTTYQEGITLNAQATQIAQLKATQRWNYEFKTFETPEANTQFQGALAANQILVIWADRFDITYHLAGSFYRYNPGNHPGAIALRGPVYIDNLTSNGWLRAYDERKVATTFDRQNAFCTAYTRVSQFSFYSYVHDISCA